MLLNPDKTTTADLLEGLAVNLARYGYRSCPCRLAVGNMEQDQDIICPCHYRQDDVTEYGFCYCGLYVSQSFISSGKPIHSIPERRPKL